MNLLLIQTSIFRARAPQTAETELVPSILLRGFHQQASLMHVSESDIICSVVGLAATSTVVNRANVRMKPESRYAASHIRNAHWKLRCLLTAHDMSIVVKVGLLSGNTASVEAGLDENVATVKKRAQTALGVGRGQLLDPCGKVLDACSLIRHAGLQNGDLLTLHLNQVKACGSDHAFAIILGDGSFVTWGNARFGGDSRALQAQLTNAQQIQSSHFAFAAILGDGSVVTWGDDRCGGDSGAVQHQLKNVQQIQASRQAFAAILGDRSVVTWGAPLYGGVRATQERLKNAQHIQVSEHAFAAIVDDGSVVTWGDSVYGADSSAVQDQLKNVQKIQASHFAFAAILGDGSVVTWGLLTKHLGHKRRHGVWPKRRDTRARHLRTLGRWRRGRRPSSSRRLHRGLRRK